MTETVEIRDFEPRPDGVAAGARGFQKREFAGNLKGYV
jgi:hypothetical protein